MHTCSPRGILHLLEPSPLLVELHLHLRQVFHLARLISVARPFELCPGMHRRGHLVNSRLQSRYSAFLFEDAASPLLRTLIPQPLLPGPAVKLHRTALKIRCPRRLPQIRTPLRTFAKILVRDHLRMRAGWVFRVLFLSEFARNFAQGRSVRRLRTRCLPIRRHVRQQCNRKKFQECSLHNPLHHCEPAMRAGVGLCLHMPDRGGMPSSAAGLGTLGIHKSLGKRKRNAAGTAVLRRSMDLNFLGSRSAGEIRITANAAPFKRFRGVHPKRIGRASYLREGNDGPSRHRQKTVTGIGNVLPDTRESPRTQASQQVFLREPSCPWWLRLFILDARAAQVFCC
jgi:hypothetical protein